MPVSRLRARPRAVLPDDTWLAPRHTGLMHQAFSDRDRAAAAVRHLHDLGWQPVLLRYPMKIPAFKDWQERLMELRELMYWTRKRVFNVGVHLGASRACAIDVDGSAPEVENFLRTHRIETPMSVITAKGRHDWFALPEAVKEVRTRIKLLDVPIDMLMGNRVAVMPPSWIAETEHRYQFAAGKNLVNPGALPLLPASLVEVLNTDVLVSRPSFERCVRHAAVRDIRNPEAWCMRVFSVEKQNGSGQLVRVVTCMRDCGRSAEESLRFLKEVWNPVCAKPPWSDCELEYCVRRHFQTGG